MMARRMVGIACLALFLAGTVGCSAVRPWERGDLARRDMGWDPDPLETQRRREEAMAGRERTGLFSHLN